jgi:hypothetical protein
MLIVWAGCYDNLFSIWNVFYNCHLLYLRMRLILYCTYILPALQHLQTVMVIGCSVQCLLLRRSSHYLVTCTLCVVYCEVITWQYRNIGSSTLLSKAFFARILTEMFHCLQLIKSRTWVKLTGIPTPCDMLDIVSLST